MDVFHEANQTMPTDSVFGDRAENQESEVELEIDLNSMDVLQVLVLSLLPPVLLPLQFKFGWLQDKEVSTPCINIT